MCVLDCENMWPRRYPYHGIPSIMHGTTKMTHFGTSGKIRELT